MQLDSQESDVILEGALGEIQHLCQNELREYCGRYSALAHEPPQLLLAEKLSVLPSLGNPVGVEEE